MLEYYESGPLENLGPEQTGVSCQTTYHRKRVKIDNADIDWGQEAVYIPINADKGLKLYNCIRDGKLAHDCQIEACFHGVGPEVLSHLKEFIFPVGVLPKYRILSRRFPTGKAYGYYTQVADTKRDWEVNDLENLKTKCMEVLSFSCADLYDRNVGWIGDRLVMIDFGFATTGTPTQRPRGHFSIVDEVPDRIDNDAIKEAKARLRKKP